MGFSKKYLQPLDVMLREYEDLGHNKFVSRYRKYDALVGYHSDEQEEFIQQVVVRNEEYVKPK